MRGWSWRNELFDPRLCSITCFTRLAGVYLQEEEVVLTMPGGLLPIARPALHVASVATVAGWLH